MPTTRFKKGSEAYSIYQQFKNVDFDRGYHHIDYAKPGPNDAVVGRKDGIVEEMEVYEYVIENYEKNEKYRRIIKGLASSRPIPWILDEDNPFAKVSPDFANGIKAKVRWAIGLIRKMLVEQHIAPGTPEYQERMAVGLYYFVFFPSTEYISARHKKLEDESRELQTIGLGALQEELFSKGGLGNILISENDADLEATALEALQAQRGFCTELSKILFAVFRMAGLKPFFVWTAEKARFVVSKTENQSTAYETHIYIGANFGNKRRYFDLAQGSSHATYSSFYPLTLRQYMALDLSNLGTDWGLKGKNDFAKAEYYLRRAIVLDPESLEPHVNLGLLLEQKNKFAEAVEEYKKALSLHPNDVLALSNVGGAYKKMGDLKNAEESIRAAIQFDPKNPLIRINLGGLLLMMGDKIDEAIQVFEGVLKMDLGNFDAADGLGIAYLKKGEPDFDKASEYFLRALAIHPQDENLLSHLEAFWWQLIEKAQGHLSKGDREKAIALMHRLENNADRELRIARDNAPVILKRLKRVTEEMSPILKADKTMMTPLVSIYQKVGNYFEGQGNFRKALVAYQKGNELDPDSADMSLGLFNVHKELGQMPEAAQACLRYKELSKAPILCP